MRTIINGYSHPETCEICILAKHVRKIIRIPFQPMTTPFELIHSDLCGLFTTKSIGGDVYFIIFIDNYTRYAITFILNNKRSETCTLAFQLFQTKVDNIGYTIKRFRCDNGSGEYNNQLFCSILASRGIRYEPSPPYTQHENGVAEHMIGTITKKARAMMLDSQVPIQFWAEAVRTATYLHARISNGALDGKNLFEVLHRY
jgi:transposase InsO family protein